MYTLGLSLFDSRVLSISSCSAEKVIGRTAESENYRGVLATLEHCHKENFCQRSSIGPGEQSVLSVVKNCQRTGKRQMGMHLATSQQYRTGISKGIKEKEGRLVFADTNVSCKLCSNSWNVLSIFQPQIL